MKNNNKGFTLVELITSFALASVIMIFIFNIVVILKNNYISKSVRTDLLIKQSLLSQKMNEDFTNNNVKDVVTCDSDKKCYEFTFADDTVKQLKISADDKTITYGDYTYELANSSYTSKINVSTKSITLDDVTINDSLLVIDIPILNKKYTDTNFGVKVVYQYNSHLVDLDVEEVTPFAFQVGDYVYMTPTSTSFTTDPSKTGSSASQTINPSELNLWRVIDIKSNGRVDMVSEYVSSATVNFNGAVGYANYVSYLDTIAKQYKNSTYTSGTRYVGSNGQTGIINNTSYFDGTTSTAPWTCRTGQSCNPVENLGGGDSLFGNDVNLLKQAGVQTLITTTPNSTETAYYYIAGRLYNYQTDGNFSFDFVQVNVNESGVFNPDIPVVQKHATAYWINSGLTTYDYNLHIRPIVTLKSGITPTGGDGTAASPYTLD